MICNNYPKDYVYQSICKKDKKQILRSNSVKPKLFLKEKERNVFTRLKIHKDSIMDKSFWNSTC